MVPPSGRALRAASVSLFQAALLPLPILHHQVKTQIRVHASSVLAQLCRSLLSLLIGQGGSKNRQGPCSCHTTMAPGHAGRVVFQSRLWSCADLPDTSPPIRCRHRSWEAQLIHTAAVMPPAEHNPTAARQGQQLPGDLPSWRGATAQGCGAISPPSVEILPSCL